MPLEVSCYVLIYSRLRKMKAEFLNVPELGECCCLADIVPPFQVCFHFYLAGYLKVQSFNKFSFLNTFVSLQGTI